ncbi:MAG: transglycosylase, partial [bacterium]|nr:transglycosylase [bacterium]
VKDNIQAGIYYDARMWVIWKAPRPLEERIAFTLASYNAGPGHILKAQGLVAAGMNPNHWAPVAAELHRVTGRHAEETRTYVERIRRLFGRLSHPP